MSKVYIVIDNGGFSRSAATLEKVFDMYKNECDDQSREELEVYEAEQIQVEFKVVKKEVPTKVVNKGAK